MTKPRFNQKHKEILDSLLLEIPGVVSGRMFGYPAYYVGGKLFACLYEEGIVHFQTTGKSKMSEWIQIFNRISHLH